MRAGGMERGEEFLAAEYLLPLSTCPWFMGKRGVLSGTSLLHVVARTLWTEAVEKRGG